MCIVFIVSTISYQNRAKIFQKILIFFIVIFYGIYCNICAKLKKIGKNNIFPYTKYRVGWRLYFRVLLLLGLIWLSINYIM